ncbi:hypothetical protein Pcinc_027156 [Petrolisthes cinctipes]|uniref:Chitin-binding type-2 domain-containing protein n=1 Tax=Petrolisthes cinctipes TaxID=88211 RepID=A0AAE1F5X3_PETCI|nr:hypothetical protein Pcinc_027156 [Petrolisthes cinctipes]
MWSTVSVCLLLLLLSAASGQQQSRRQQSQQQSQSQPQQAQFASDCPSPDGYFADARQCDKYYKCVDGVLEEKLCPDGLAFVDHNPRIEKCDYISQVDCTGRPELQPAQPTTVCPRQNGYFFHEDTNVCDKFYFCNAGTANLINCPEGLVFYSKTNNCVWPDVANREGCSASGVVQFDCPKVGKDIAVSHPRYADPDDCQYFYVCIDGINPRRNGCAFGHVYSHDIQSCTDPKDVPECGNYYTEYFDQYFKTLKATDGRPSADVIAAAINSGYPLPDFPSRVNLENNPSPANRRRRPSTSSAAAPAPSRTAAVPSRSAARPVPTRSAARPVPVPVPAPARTAARPLPARPAARPFPAPAPAPPVFASAAPAPAPAPPVFANAAPAPAPDSSVFASDAPAPPVFDNAEFAPAPLPSPPVFTNAALEPAPAPVPSPVPAPIPSRAPAPARTPAFTRTRPSTRQQTTSLDAGDAPVLPSRTRTRRPSRRRPVATAAPTSAPVDVFTDQSFVVGSSVVPSAAPTTAATGGEGGRRRPVIRRFRRPGAAN